MKVSPLLLAILLLPFALMSQGAAVRAKHFNLDSDKLAIQGYDPVAYFTQHRAVRGSKTHAATHEGVTYYFSDESNKQTFLKNPIAYEPQYGGWCAFAMGDYGKKVSINPETFKILNGKLYLFYNAYFNNTLSSWNKDEQHLKTQADATWKGYLGK